MRILLALVCFTCLLRAQTDQRNEVTFGGGFAKSVGRFGSEIDTVVGLGGTYGYRLLPYLQLETGAFVALNPTPRICTSGDHCSYLHDRFIWVPFGPRFVIPVKNRLEVSLGGGGVFEKYVSGANPTGGSAISRNDWGEYLAAGAAVAVRRHFWLSVTPRWFFTNTYHDRWFVLTGNISFRF